MVNQGTHQRPIFAEASTSQTYAFTQSQNRQRRCSDCGKTLKPNAHFCFDCGTQVLSGGSFATWFKARPSLSRRLQAELIDRIAPFGLAFVVATPLALVSLRYFFWLFAGVLFAWHLLRDCSPQRRSFGKWRRGLRVVTIKPQQQCAWWQALLRRLPSAIGQLAYVMGVTALFAHFTGWDRLMRTVAAPWPIFAQSNHFIPLLLLLPLIYDLAASAALLISPEARRLEDYLFGTQVILEEAYAHELRVCKKCEQLMTKDMTFCQRCGEANGIEIGI